MFSLCVLVTLFEKEPDCLEVAIALQSNQLLYGQLYSRLQNHGGELLAGGLPIPFLPSLPPNASRR